MQLINNIFSQGKLRAWIEGKAYGVSSDGCVNYCKNQTFNYLKYSELKFVNLVW